MSFFLVRREFPGREATASPLGRDEAIRGTTHISRGVVTRLGPSTRHCVNASKNTACMTVEKKKRRATPRELPMAYRVENLSLIHI